jgi:hypothetical protein
MEQYIKVGLVISGILFLAFSCLAVGSPETNSNGTVNEPMTPTTIPTTTETTTETTTTPETTVQTSLIIDTYPEGATIILDGNNVGETPGTVPCGPGTYEMRLHLDGYEDITEMVTAGKEGTRLEYTLTEEQTNEEETTNEESETVEENTEDIQFVDVTPVCTPDGKKILVQTPADEGAIPTTLKSLPLDKVVSQKSVKCLEFDTWKKCSIVTINGKDYYLVEK